MAAFRPRFSRHTAVAGLALLAALVATTRAWSQGHTPDPYNFVGEYNRGYEPYMFPAYPNDQGVIPGQAALQGRSGLRQANQYRNFVEELDGVDARDDVFAPTRGFRSGAGVPYYQAYRQYDRDYLRYYAPNQTADQTYYENQKARHDKHLQYQEAAREKYAQYVREADPTRRTRLYREYLDLDQRANLEMGTSRGTPAQAGRTTPAAATLAVPSTTNPRSRTPATSGSIREGLSPSTAPTPGRGTGLLDSVLPSPSSPFAAGRRASWDRRPDPRGPPPRISSAAAN